jgi:hypothetical protein
MQQATVWLLARQVSSEGQLIPLSIQQAGGFLKEA